MASGLQTIAVMTAPTQSPPIQTSAPWRRGWFALSGMLVVVLLLAGSLLTTALFSYRAAQQAATAVLYSRAAEVATSVGAALRGVDDAQAQRQAVEELASDAVGIVLCGVGGKVRAVAGRPNQALTRGAAVPGFRSMLREVRSKGSYHRMVSIEGQAYLEYWQPIRGGPPRPRWRRWWKRGGRPFDPPPADPRPDPKMWMPRGPGWGLHPHPHGPHLVRVSVSAAVADDLLVPARYTLVMAAVAAGLLGLLALVMYRADGRARRNEQELQRRRALSALGEMAAVLAHEIRTPLGSIKGNAQLVAEERPTDRRVSSMVQEAGRLERLVNGLLDYARPPEPRRASTDPDEVAERAAQIVAPRAEAAGVSLIVDPARCGRCLRADADQLVQVLVNLLQNAVEACGEPGASGTHVALRIRHARGRVTFTVLDSGAGIDEAQLAQLLQPFFSTKQNGTGLGLSVARQIVEQHGGQLTLATRKEGGAVVEASLPVNGALT